MRCRRFTGCHMALRAAVVVIVVAVASAPSTIAPAETIAAGVASSVAATAHH